MALRHQCEEHVRHVFGARPDEPFVAERNHVGCRSCAEQCSAQPVNLSEFQSSLHAGSLLLNDASFAMMFGKYCSFE
jgi:hypothetical protein